VIDQPFSVGFDEKADERQVQKNRTRHRGTQNFPPQNSVIRRIFFAICIAGDANFHAAFKSTALTSPDCPRGTENAGLWSLAPTKLSLAN
jgi:hypothetical protein